MKSKKLGVVIVSTLGFLFGVTVAAWAGGAGGVLACCVVDNPGGGAIALQGTVTVVGVPSPPSSAYIDVKLRMERGGKFGFFELHLDEDVFGKDNYEIMCQILNPNEPPLPRDPASVTAVNNLVDEILTFFFPGSPLNHTNTRLVITRKSITLTDGSAGSPIPDTDRVAAIGDVVVYVVDPASAKYESNGSCPSPR